MKQPIYVAFSTQKGGARKDNPYRADSFLSALCKRKERSGNRLRLPATLHF